ncbi:MAG TPA: energy transducer TonB [Longimicrobium sp.]|nr:energy transducer TonB [Longimicrobium sp.]
MNLLASPWRPLLAAALLCIPATAAAQARAPLPQNDAYTEPPQLLNQAEVTALALSSYPQQLKDMGLGGSPHVRLFIDATGAVAERRIERSSALPALDSAALKVVDAMRFAPAKNGDTPTHLWVTLPVQFRIAAATGQPEPFKTPPRITNLRELSERLGNRMAYRTTRADHWPRLRVFVSKDGMPAAIEMNDPSGDAALDSAAMLAALAARFEPARNAAGQPVETWMVITVRPDP